MASPSPRGWKLGPDTLVEMECGDGQWRPYKAMLAKPLPSGGVQVTFAPQFDFADKPLIQVAGS